MGYDSTAHYLYPNVDLDYQINFENKTSTTINNVIILVSISPFLDITTLEMGAASHPYTWSLEAGNVLKITFNNIALADSINNPNEFRGFVRYRIQQQKDNAIGSVIYNTGYIYMDSNLPIATNATWHTIDSNFAAINVSVAEIFVPKTSVNIYPNPFRQQTTIKVESTINYEHLELRVVDLTSRQVKQIQCFHNNSIQISRKGLSKGIYFYQLQGDGKLISTGKIMVLEEN